MKRFCYKKTSGMTPAAVYLLFRSGAVKTVSELCKSFNVSRAMYYASPYSIELEMARIIGEAEYRKKLIDEETATKIADLRNKVV